MFDKDDQEAEKVRYVFKSLKFDYHPMNGQVIDYNYDKAKDFIKWVGLKPKEYIPLIEAMFINFRSNLPSK